ncbi:MAG TPA: type II secretion system protein N [Woeseiaceae bacterium]|nr:type II secretion system protein N [Woeseiaceae bacterium]
MAGLIVLFPARVAYHWIAPDTVRLSGITGTVWSGTAAEGSFGGVYVSNLTWRFRPLALLTGKAGYSIAGDPVSGSFAGNVAIGPGGAIHLSDLSARLRIAAVSSLGMVAGVDGMIDLQFDSLVLRDGLPVRGSGTVQVVDLVARQLSSSPLGDYRARIRTLKDVVSGEIEDVSGVLDVAGTLELRPDRSYALIGKVAATDGAPARVVQQLGYLGSPDANGMRSFRLEGRL